MIRGVGPVYARKLVRAFGDKVFDVIEATPDRLREVDGIGPVRAASVLAAWAEQKAVRGGPAHCHQARRAQMINAINRPSRNRWVPAAVLPSCLLRQACDFAVLAMSVLTLCCVLGTGPIYEACLCLQTEGWHGTIHPALTMLTVAAALARWLNALRLHRLERRAFGHQYGREIAPQRDHQLARQGHDSDEPDAFAGVESARLEPLRQRAVRLVEHPQPGELDRHLVMQSHFVIAVTTSLICRERPARC